MSDVLAEGLAQQLVDKLKEKQAERGETDSQFGLLLGISGELWRKVRTGRLSPGATMVYATLATWSDLYGPTLAYMIQKGISVSGNGFPAAAGGNPFPDKGSPTSAEESQKVAP